MTAFLTSSCTCLGIVLATVSSAACYGKGLSDVGQKPTVRAPVVERAPIERHTSVSDLNRRIASSWFAQNGGRLHFGKPSRPVMLLVHGIHSDAEAWLAPTRSTGGSGRYFYDFRHTPPAVKLTRSYPGVGYFKVGKSDRSRGPMDRNNWFDFLVRHGFTVATWSQPGETFGPAYTSAVQAYRHIVEATQGPIALLGHSRGGLIIRKLLKEQVLGEKVGLDRVKWVVTLHSPHQGSELGRIGRELRERLSGNLDRVPLEDVWKSKLREMFEEDRNELLDMIVTPGQIELAPDSSLIQGLRAGEKTVPGVKYFTFAGTTPDYIRYYAWKFTDMSAVPQYKCQNNNPAKCKQYFRWEAIPKEIPLISPVYSVVPIAPEVTRGKGDGLVADARARLPWLGAIHKTNSLNHAEALWDRGMQMQVVSLFADTGVIGGKRSGRSQPPIRR